MVRGTFPIQLKILYNTLFYSDLWYS